MKIQALFTGRLLFVIIIPGKIIIQQRNFLKKLIFVWRAVSFPKQYL
jgi:hypothetical protein